MNILLTGSSGLCGNAIALAAERRGIKVTGIYHTRKPTADTLAETIPCDLTDTDALTSIVLERFPDAIVHTAALSNPESCQADPEKARQINVTVPTRLAELANHISAPLIHLSTDMVFNGYRGDYQSTDTPSPANFYGELKLEAEKAILQRGGNFATILRIAIVTGNSPYGQRSLHEKLFAQWAAGKRAKLFTDEIRQPVSADNIADVIIELLERKNLHGLFHWAGAETLSRYEIGQRILKHFNLPDNLIEPASIEDYDDDRPAKLTLQTKPLDGKLKTKAQTFDEQLEQFVVPKPARDWYHSL